MTPSPACHVSAGNAAKAARTVKGTAPKWTGISSPWATTLPAASRSAQERSAERLRRGDNDAFHLCACRRESASDHFKRYRIPLDDSAHQQVFLPTITITSPAFPVTALCPACIQTVDPACSIKAGPVIDPDPAPST